MNLVFLINVELYKKFCRSSEILSNMTSQIKYKKTGITLDLDLTLVF